MRSTGKEEAEEHGKSILQVLHMIVLIFSDIIRFQHVLHLGVGRSKIKWKLKVKTDISVST